MNVQRLNETFLSAVWHPQEKIIPLIDRCIELGVDVNCCDEAGVTALMRAAASTTCQTEVVKHLINKGCDVRTKGPSGMTALIYAVIYDHLELARLFLEKGSDSNECDVNGKTSLLYALNCNSLDIVPLLVKKGCNINCSIHGMTPLMYAIVYNLRDIVMLLVENGCNISDSSVMHYAHQNRNDTIVNILLEAGAVCRCSQCKVTRRSLINKA